MKYGKFWWQLTEPEREEVLAQFKGWDSEKLENAEWFATVYDSETVWTARFDAMKVRWCDD